MAKAYADYTVHDIKRLDYSFLIKNKDEDKQKEQKEAFDYIFMMLQLQKLPTSIKLLEYFGTDDNEVITDKAEINKRLFEIRSDDSISTNNYGHNKMVELESQFLEQLKSISNHQARMNTLQGNKSTYERRLDEYINRVQEYNQLLSKVNDEISTLEIQMANGNQEQEMLEDIKKIIENPFYQFIGRSTQTGKFYFATTDNVILTQRNPAANIDIRVNMGAYLIGLKFDRNYGPKLSVLPFINNIIHHQYYHPHVSSAGSICWGDQDRRIADLTRDRKISDVFVILQSILTQYSHENPYMRLSEFDEQVKRNVKRVSKRLPSGITKDDITIMPELLVEEPTDGETLNTTFERGSIVRLNTSFNGVTIYTWEYQTHEWIGTATSTNISANSFLYLKQRNDYGDWLCEVFATEDLGNRQVANVYIHESNFRLCEPEYLKEAESVYLVPIDYDTTCPNCSYESCHSDLLVNIGLGEADLDANHRFECNECGHEYDAEDL